MNWVYDDLCSRRLCSVRVCCDLQHINFYALHQGLHSTGLNVSCLGKLKRHTTSRIVKCIMKGEVPPGQAERWDNEPLQVPSLPPSRLDGCKIIEIFYTLTVRFTFTSLQSSSAMDKSDCFDF